MFKKVTKIELAGIIGVGTLVGASSFVSAADYKSKAKIEFMENNDITLPVDPEDPTIPGEPGPGDKDTEDENYDSEGTSGPLSIDYASHFNFGTPEKIAGEKTYTAESIPFNNDDKKVAPYVQVTDNRGSNSGWTLSVDQEGQLKTETDEELLGAVITIGKGDAKGTLLTAAEGLTTNEVVLDPEIGNAQVIFGAENLTVGGTFVSSFGSAEDVDVKLTIAAGTKIETAEYTTDLNWTLEDTPLN